MNSYTYADVVDILRISQERVTARKARFEAFRRAVSFYRESYPFEWLSRDCYLVAGTNGKGTVAKTLETLLGSEGTGLYTSPHLMEPTERIRSYGQDLTPDEMVRFFEMIEPTVSRFDLSHFEILTLLMFEAFFGGRVRPRVSRAIIEVGVGGRLDPTRVVGYQTAVLAKIGLDHEPILGSTIELIAKEKLAIAEGAERLVYMKPVEELAAVFAEAQIAHPSCTFIESRSFESEVLPGPKWRMRTPWGEAPLSLLGERAVQNTSLALEALNANGITPILSRLKDVVWPGRMERVQFQGRDVFLSGDHNEQGVESLRDLLRAFSYERVRLVVGVGKGKPVEAMLRAYEQIPRADLVLTMTTFRPMDPADFAALPSAAKFDRPLDALKHAVSLAGPRDLVVVSGSLYLVGDLRAALLSKTGGETS